MTREPIPADADLSYILSDLRHLAMPISQLLPDPVNARLFGLI